MKDFKLSALLARLAESPRVCERTKFWKLQNRKHKPSDGPTGGSTVLMCNNFQDAQLLNGLILQKVKTLKTVENIYTKDTSSSSSSSRHAKIILSGGGPTCEVVEDDTYSEVFDSLNRECSAPPPPPLPSRRSFPPAPARPAQPPPPHMRRSSQPRTV